MAKEKQQKLRSLEKKIRPMEDLFHEFRTWMSSTEEKLAALSPAAIKEEERREQLELALVSESNCFIVLSITFKTIEYLYSVCVSLFCVHRLLSEMSRSTRKTWTNWREL